MRYIRTRAVRGKEPPRTTHIIRSRAAWDPELYRTVCGHWRRGAEVTGESGEYPLCVACEKRVLRGQTYL